MVFERSGLLLLLIIPVCLSQNRCINDAQCPIGQTCQQFGNPNGGYSNQCVQRGSTSSCNRDSDCPQGSGCYNINGILTCQVTGGGLGGGSNGKICYSNSDCGFNEQCIYVNGVNQCQITAGGPSSCHSDSDCQQGQGCYNINGVLSCQITAGGIGSGGNSDDGSSGKICYNNNDCGFNEQCITANGVSRCQITAGGIGNGGNTGQVPEPRRRRAVMPIALTPKSQGQPPFIGSDFGGNSYNGNGQNVPRMGPFIRIGPPFARSAPLAQLLNAKEQH